MSEKTVKNFFGNAFLAAPLALVILNLVLAIWYQGGRFEIRGEIWTHWRQIAAVFYSTSLLGLFCWFLVDLPRERNLSFLGLFIRWILGFSLIWFTFAISGLISDATYFIFAVLKTIKP